MKGFLEALPLKIIFKEDLFRPTFSYAKTLFFRFFRAIFLQCKTPFLSSYYGCISKRVFLDQKIGPLKMLMNTNHIDEIAI